MKLVENDYFDFTTGLIGDLDAAESLISVGITALRTLETEGNEKAVFDLEALLRDVRTKVASVRHDLDKTSVRSPFLEAA
jgi:hypothetical protein